MQQVHRPSHRGPPVVTSAAISSHHPCRRRILSALDLASQVRGDLTVSGHQASLLAGWLSRGANDTSFPGNHADQAVAFNLGQGATERVVCDTEARRQLGLRRQRGPTADADC